MKNKLIALLVLLATPVFAQSSAFVVVPPEVVTVTNVVTQTNFVASSGILGNGVLKGLYNFGSGVLKNVPTNIIVAPYFTYAPPKVAGQKTYGYGLALGYNFSQNVGIFAAIDHLDKTTLINGQLKLQATIHPFQNLPLIHPGTNTWFYRAAVTPNVIGGVVSDVTAGGNSIGTVEGAGASIDLFKIGNGNVVIGYEYVTMSFISLEASRQRHQLFVGYSTGF